MSELRTASTSEVESVNVLIVGGGPTGLFLAAEMARAGVRATVLECRTEPMTEDKAHGVLGQAVRLLAARGVVERAGRAAPTPAPHFFFGGLTLPLSELGDGNPLYTFPINQRELEDVLRSDALELGVDLRVGWEVASFEQLGDAVSVRVRRPDAVEAVISAGYIVGCDGSRSFVRKTMGFGFSGVTEQIVDRSAIVMASDRIRIVPGGVEVEGYGRLDSFMHCTERGVFYVVPHNPERPIVGTSEWAELSSAEAQADMTLAELEDSVERVLGVRVPLQAPPSDEPPLLRRLDHRNSRVADRYHDRRVFIAGDAAHVSHGPTINTALQDAANLGWKLAAVIRGTAGVDLLDSYETERRPLGERVCVATESETALLAPGGDVTALRTVFAEMLRDAAALARVGGLLAGSGTRYGTPDDTESPLVGWFVSQVSVTIDGQSQQLDALLGDGTPLLIDASTDPAIAVAASTWTERVKHVPVAGLGLDETAVLIRPDGYVAWAGNDTAGLEDALARWFGARD